MLLRRRRKGQQQSLFVSTAAKVVAVGLAPALELGVGLRPVLHHLSSKARTQKELAEDDENSEKDDEDFIYVFLGRFSLLVVFFVLPLECGSL